MKTKAKPLPEIIDVNGQAVPREVYEINIWEAGYNQAKKEMLKKLTKCPLDGGKVCGIELKKELEK